MTEEPYCGNCKFFADNESNHSDRWGNCNRYPPVYKSGYNKCFPITVHVDHWCGEHQDVEEDG